MARHANKLKGYNNPFAIRLRELMLDSEQKTTQEELATAIGCSRQAISQYMDGTSVPNIDKLLGICDFFDISCDYLLGLTEVKTRDDDLRFVCEYTGLNEESVYTLKESRNKICSICDTINSFFSEKCRYYFFQVCDMFTEYRFFCNMTNDSLEKLIKKYDDSKLDFSKADTKNIKLDYLNDKGMKDIEIICNQYVQYDEYNGQKELIVFNIIKNMVKLIEKENEEALTLFRNTLDKNRTVIKRITQISRKLY